ncbi:MAG: GNAT family N-acetyltransferase [Gemmatimonadetes bacterium]|nr:GNAT family N-acetyltransferase [Gemmatimonadota bacterium]
MGQILETERLILRPFEEGDLDDVYRLIYSDVEVCRYYTDRQLSLEEMRERLTYRIPEARFSDFCRWAVVEREENRFLGLIGLEAGPNFWYRFKDDPNPRFNEVEVELSFAFGKEFWGRGYATEASRKVIEYAFTELKIPRLVGGAAAENARSVALQRRLGFRVEKEVGGEGYVTLLENDLI